MVATRVLDAQVKALVQQLSLGEKIDLVSGKVVVADDRHPSPPPSRETFVAARG